MTSKSEAQQKINKAGNACSEIHKSLNAAYSSVTRRLSTNGFGIYQDVSEVRNLIADTQAELEKATKLLNAVSWPTNDDYDQVE